MAAEGSGYVYSPNKHVQRVYGSRGARGGRKGARPRPAGKPADRLAAAAAAALGVTGDDEADGEFTDALYYQSLGLAGGLDGAAPAGGGPSGGLRVGEDPGDLAWAGAAFVGSH